MESDVIHRLTGGGPGLRALLDAIEAQLDAARAPPTVTGPVLIACDEIVSNIINHGGADDGIEVAVRVQDGRVVVRIDDDGAPFDPTAAATPDTGLALEDREVGGLGIYLVREMMDDVRYERRGGRNHMAFSKAFPPASAS
jgi:serine/threonine-protein kinase RsbW